MLHHSHALRLCVVALIGLTLARYTDVDDEDIQSNVELMQLGVNVQRGRRSNVSDIAFSSVDCVRVITLEGSDQLARMEEELDRVGLRSRATIQTESPDPEGGMAGCFRAHVKAWNAALEA